MQYRNNLTNEWANAYFRVVRPFPAYLLVGISEAQTYVGSSRMLGNVYEHRELRPGDEIHDIHGGVFAVVREGRSYQAYAAKIQLSDKHPFEKTYGEPPLEIWPVERLERLEARQALVPPGGYNRKMTLRAPGERYGRNIDSVVPGARRGRGLSGTGDDLHRRIADVLGWRVEETRRFALQDLRELVRPLSPKLVHEIDHAIRGGAYVAWSGARPPVEDIWAQNNELLVREAFAWAAMQVPEYAARGAQAVAAGVAWAARSSWPDDKGWLTPPIHRGHDPNKVLVFTECCPPDGATYVLRDPFRSSSSVDYDMWSRAVEHLERSPWIEDAGWESINSAVHYVWIRPRIVG